MTFLQLLSTPYLLPSPPPPSPPTPPPVHLIVAAFLCAFLQPHCTLILYQPLYPENFPLLTINFVCNMAVKLCVYPLLRNHPYDRSLSLLVTNAYTLTGGGSHFFLSCSITVPQIVVCHLPFSKQNMKYG